MNWFTPTYIRNFNTWYSRIYIIYTNLFGDMRFRELSFLNTPPSAHKRFKENSLTLWIDVSFPCSYSQQTESPYIDLDITSFNVIRRVLLELFGSIITLVGLMMVPRLLALDWSISLVRFKGGNSDLETAQSLFIAGMYEPLSCLFPLPSPRLSQNDFRGYPSEIYEKIRYEWCMKLRFSFSFLPF